MVSEAEQPYLAAVDSARVRIHSQLIGWVRELHEHSRPLAEWWGWRLIDGVADGVAAVAGNQTNTPGGLLRRTRQRCEAEATGSDLSVKELYDRLATFDRAIRGQLESRRWRLATTMGQPKSVKDSQAACLKVLDEFRRWRDNQQEQILLHHPNQEDDKPCILFVAHLAEPHLFGGIRSFVERVRATDRERFRIVCVCPQFSGPLVECLKPCCDEITIFPYSFWSKGQVAAGQVDHFVRFMLSRHIDLVHANTITMIAPLIAARVAGVPVVLHAHELITGDPVLAEWIGHTPETIVSVVKQLADYTIGCSEAVTSLFDKGEATTVLPNCVDTEDLNLAVQMKSGMTVSLISCNHKKKGIEDFAEIAWRSAAEGLPVNFLLIGPFTPAAMALQEKQKAGELPLSLGSARK